MWCVTSIYIYQCDNDMCVQAIWEELQDVVHAVDAMVTKTPEEVGRS